MWPLVRLPSRAGGIQADCSIARQNSRCPEVDHSRCGWPPTQQAASTVCLSWDPCRNTTENMRVKHPPDGGLDGPEATQTTAGNSVVDRAPPGLLHQRGVTDADLAEAIPAPTALIATTSNWTGAVLLKVIWRGVTVPLKSCWATTAPVAALNAVIW